jgi:hypothetical protein
MERKTMLRALKGALISTSAFAAFATAAGASPVIDGVNLTQGWQSSQSVDFISSGKVSTTVGSGTLYLSEDAAGNVYFALVQPIGVNNNVYGTTSTGGLGGSDTTDPEFNWPGKGGAHAQ